MKPTCKKYRLIKSVIVPMLVRCSEMTFNYGNICTE